MRRKRKVTRGLLELVITTGCLLLFCILLICIVKAFRDEEITNEGSAYEAPIVVDDRVEPETEEETKKTEEESKKPLKTNEEVADDVINGLYGDGKARIRKLKKEGYDVSLIQALVDKKLSTNVIYGEDIQYNSEDIVYENEEQYYPNSSEALNSYNGEVQYNGHRETYYSQQVLPGEGLNIPGRHVAEDGTVRDGDGYICVAANEAYLPYGSIVETSLGKAKVYDSGCDYGTIDIYTNW